MDISNTLLILLLKLNKGPSRGTYTPDHCYHLFLKSTNYVALTLEMAVICYINTTLEEFIHTLGKAHDLDLKGKAWVCLFVLRFYGPISPMGSCRARSVYLTTRLLGRLSPLSG